MNITKHNVTLTVTSLLSIVLFWIHVTDDVVRGFDRFPNPLGMLIWVVWLYGTLMLAERRSGQVIMLLGGLLAAAVPVLHMRGTGAVAKSDGAFLFLGTLLALGVTGMFSIILSARGLWLLIRKPDGRMIAIENESPDRRG